MRWPLVLSVCAPLALPGCGGYEPVTPNAAAKTTQAPLKPAVKPAPAPAPTQPSGTTVGMQAIGAAAGLAPLETAVQGPAGVAPAGRSASPPAQPVPQPNMQVQEAKVGVGKRGHGYGEGLIATPAAVYFRAQERILFDQVKYALKLYKAQNGAGPKSHAEFMEQIIKANNLKLPELPTGGRYEFDPARVDPDTGEAGMLMVHLPPR